MLLYKTLQLVFRLRTTYGTLLIASLSGFSLSLIVFTTAWIYTFDQRCLQEIQTSDDPIQITNGTKTEIIKKFKEIYDVDLTSDAAVPNPGQLADSWMNCRQVQPDGNANLGSVLKWLSTVPITKSLGSVPAKSYISKRTGQSGKFKFILEGGYKALFKVKWYERDVALPIDRMKTRRERHNGEIASYHLQRILGFNRIPVTVGRFVNFTKEILPVADDQIRNNVYYKGNDVCVAQIGSFTSGHIVRHDLCAKNGIFEGALILWLPRDIYLRSIYLWSTQREGGHVYEAYAVEQVYPIWRNHPIKSLDFADMLLLDYLIQNSDRNALYFDPSMYSSILYLDHGKSFGNPFIDFNSILEGFSYICKIRQSTYTRLRLLSEGTLSTVLRHILSKDPIAPVLWEPHYAALNRRLSNILNSINDCIKKYGAEKVIIDTPHLYKNAFSHFTFAQHYASLRYFVGY